MKIKAILFDLDGTLLDTLEDICDTMNRVLKERGFPAHELDSYRHFVGDGAAVLVFRSLPEDRRDDRIVNECHEAFKKYYELNWNIKTKEYDGVPEMLNAVKELGLRIAVLSNKPHKFTKQCVEEFLPHWKFDIALGLRASVPRKPDPAGAMEVSQKLGIPPSGFLYVGDTPVDMKTANAAGMYPVGVSWGFRSSEELLENGARKIIKHPLELLDVIE